MIFRPLLLVMLLFAIGCSDLINESELESKRGLLYNPKNSKPYSGKVYRLYSTGSKMREGVFDLGAIDGSYTYYDNEGSIINPIEENMLDLKDGKKYFSQIKKIPLSFHEISKEVNKPTNNYPSLISKLN